MNPDGTPRVVAAALVCGMRLPAADAEILTAVLAAPGFTDRTRLVLADGRVLTGPELLERVAATVDRACTYLSAMTRLA